MSPAATPSADDPAVPRRGDGRRARKTPTAATASGTARPTRATPREEPRIWSAVAPARRSRPARTPAVPTAARSQASGSQARMTIDEGGADEQSERGRAEQAQQTEEEQPAADDRARPTGRSGFRHRRSGRRRHPGSRSAPPSRRRTRTSRSPGGRRPPTRSARRPCRRPSRAPRAGTVRVGIGGHGDGRPAADDVPAVSSTLIDESFGSGRSPNVIVTAVGGVARFAPALGSDDCGSACAAGVRPTGQRRDQRERRSRRRSRRSASGLARPCRPGDGDVDEVQRRTAEDHPETTEHDADGHRASMRSPWPAGRRHPRTRPRCSLPSPRWYRASARRPAAAARRAA